MNKKQMDLCLRGADLLKGHMRQLARSLDAALAAGDTNKVLQMVDPLVHIAGVLVRKAAITMGVSGQAAFARVILECDPDLGEEYLILERIFAMVIDGGVPNEVTCDHALLALAAQEVGTSCVHAIAAAQESHPMKVIGELQRLIRERDPSVEITGSAEASASLVEYATDTVMSECRQATAETLVRLTGDVGNSLYTVSRNLHEVGEGEAAIAYNGASRAAKTAESLSAGVVGLTSNGNHYAARALQRQVVECEYLLWKFSTEPSSVADWMQSTREQREADWKPSRLYSDADNNYRRKDYSLHCEYGGHPTPDGTLTAGHALEPDLYAVSTAELLSHLLFHLLSVWEYAVACADALDQMFGQPTTVAQSLRDEYSSIVQTYLRTDKFGAATSHFSDPT